MTEFKILLKKLKVLISNIENLKNWTIVLVLMSIIGSLFGLGIGHGLRTLVKYASIKDWTSAQNGLLFFIIVLISSNLYKILFPIVLEQFTQKTLKNIRKRILKDTFRNYNNLSSNEGKGNYLETLITDSKKITSLLIDTIDAFIEYPITAISTIIYLILTSNICMIFVGVLISLISLLVAKIFNTSLSNLSKFERNIDGCFTQFTKEIFSDNEILKFSEIFNWIVGRNKYFCKTLMKYRMKKMNTEKLVNIMQVDFAVNLTNIIIMSIGSLLFFYNLAKIDDLIAFIFLFHRVVKPFQNMFNIIITISSQLGSVEKIESYYKNNDSVLDQCSNYQSHRFNSIEKLSLKDFKLLIKDKLLFEVEDISWQQGKISCIIGKNGFGKSTLINTLLGHHCDFHGKILINNEVLDNYNLANYRNNFAVMEQESFLFSDTIEDNIIFEDTKINNDKLSRIIEFTGLSTFLTQIDSQLNHKFNNNISSGQKKLISLCRALYKDSFIIILDEPTESLDNDHINLLKNLLNTLKKDHIIIIITHNENIKNIADDIFFIKDNQLCMSNGGIKV